MKKLSCRNIRILLVLLCFCTLTSLSAEAADKTSSKTTIKKLLQTALMPVGSTVYVWGGG